MTKIKQKRLAKEVKENVGNVGNKRKKKTLGQMMIDAGYSEATATGNPGRTLESKSFKDKLNELLPDDDVLQAHKDLFGAGHLQQYTFPNTEKNEDIKVLINNIPGCRLILIRTLLTKRKGVGMKTAYFLVPDNRSRKDAIDMAYKLKGNYPAQKFKLDDGDIDEMGEEELQEKMRETDEMADRFKKFKKGKKK